MWFGCFFVSSNARTKEVRAEPSPLTLSEALRRHQMRPNEVFGTDKLLKRLPSMSQADGPLGSLTRSFPIWVVRSVGIICQCL